MPSTSLAFRIQGDNSKNPMFRFPPHFSLEVAVRHQVPLDAFRFITKSYADPYSKPCRRCQREAKDCVLGESHRGGRRVRKKPKLDPEGSKTPVTPSNLGFQGASKSSDTPTSLGFPSSAGQSSNYSPHVSHHNPQPSQSYPNQYNNRPDQAFGWQQPTPTNTAASDTSRHTEQTNVGYKHVFKTSY
jgi:hypothetical protein